MVRIYFIPRRNRPTQAIKTRPVTPRPAGARETRPFCISEARQKYEGERSHRRKGLEELQGDLDLRFRFDPVLQGMTREPTRGGEKNTEKREPRRGLVQIYGSPNSRLRGRGKARYRYLKTMKGSPH